MHEPLAVNEQLGSVPSLAAKARFAVKYKLI
jgi:hypothetical protein